MCAVPKMYDTEILNVNNVEVGKEAVVKEEFKSPSEFNPKFQGFLMGKVALGDAEYLLGINKTSYREIASIYGEDTADWTDKSIVYMGKKKMGAMEGHSWNAKA